MRWSIRTKILAVLSALLLAAMFAHLVMAERIFRQDKILLLFDTNRANTERMADQLDNSVRRVVDKMELIGRLSAGNSRLAREIFESDDELLAFQLIVDGAKLSEFLSNGKAQKAGLRSAVESTRAIAPVRTAGPTDLWQVENISVRDSVLFLVRIPVHVNGASSAFAQAVIDGRKWEARFSQHQNLALSFAVTPSGKAILHPRVSVVTARKDFSSLPLIKFDLSKNFMRRQAEFDYEGRTWFGVIQKVKATDLLVVSMTDKQTALAAVSLLLEKTLLFSGIIISIALVFTVFFANSLTVPLLSLVRATQEIGKGRFDIRVPVSSRDEVGALATAFDKMASDLKLSREQLQDHSRTLERKVQERTQELEQQHDVLIKTTRLAAVGEAAGNAAHEVLNPLTSIISRLEAISLRLRRFYGSEETPLATLKAITSAWKKDFSKGGEEAWLQAMRHPSQVDPSKTLAREDLENTELIAAQFDRFGESLLADIEVLSKEAHRISRIVQNMRGLSRLSKVRTIIDIGELLRDSLKNYQLLLSRYRIQSEVVTACPCNIRVDVDEMRQVISNLITNAVEAIEDRRTRTADQTLAGQLRFDVCCADHSTILRVRDNGVGISPELWDKVFDMHFTTKGAKGTGLGLGICRQFVAGAGGTIAVNASEPGKFTEFEIRFPVEREHA